MRGRCGVPFRVLRAIRGSLGGSRSFWGEGAEAFGGEEFAGDDVEHVFALAAVKRAVVEADGYCHVGAHGGVGVGAVDVVVEVAEVVEECGDEWLRHFSSGFAKAGFIGVPSARREAKMRALYQRALNSTRRPERGTMGCPPREAFIHDMGFSVPSVFTIPLLSTLRRGVSLGEDEVEDVTYFGEVFCGGVFASVGFGILLE